MCVLSVAWSLGRRDGFTSLLTIKVQPSSKIGQSPPCTLVRTGWNYTLRKRSEFHGHLQRSVQSRGVVVRLRCDNSISWLGVVILAVVLSHTAGFLSRAVSPVMHAETKVRTMASHCHKLLLAVSMDDVWHIDQYAMR